MRCVSCRGRRWQEWEEVEWTPRQKSQRSAPPKPLLNLNPHLSLSLFMSHNDPTMPTPSAPPKPREYIAPESRISRHPEYPKSPEPPILPRASLLSRLWPFKRSKPRQETMDFGKPDLSRGIQASRDVVKQGILNPRYRAFATRLTIIMAVSPVAIVLTYELAERRFGGKEQKPFPMHKVNATEQVESAAAAG